MTVRTVDVSGVTEVNFDPAGTNPTFYLEERYVWIKNRGTDVMYASVNPNPSAGSSGTAMILSRTHRRLELTPANKIYLKGEGCAEIQTGETAECPF